MDWGPPGSSVHGIFQVRILEWVAISLSKESSQLRDQTHQLQHNYAITPNFSFKNSTHLLSGVKNLSTA